MPPRVNLRSSAVKRIMQEAAELADPDTDDFVAGPLESDIFEWHCTLRGVKGTDYEGGLYHLRILLPPSYPMSAPDIVLLTPNGRFELGKKICIDGLTSFHAGSWQPAWGVRTAITGLRSFWTQEGEALSAIGALDYPKDERRRLAKISREWTCPTCGIRNDEHLPPAPTREASTSASAVGTPTSRPASAVPAEPASGPASIPAPVDAVTVNPTPVEPQPVERGAEPDEAAEPATVQEPPAAPQAEHATALSEPSPQPLADNTPSPAFIPPRLTNTPPASRIDTPAQPSPPQDATPATTPARAATPAQAAAPGARRDQSIPPGLAAALADIRANPGRPERLTPLWLDMLIGFLVMLLIAILLGKAGL